MPLAFPLAFPLVLLTLFHLFDGRLEPLLQPVPRAFDDRAARFARACARAACTAAASAIVAFAVALPARAQDAAAPAEPAAAPPPSSSQASQAALPSVGVQVAGGNGFALSADGRSRLHLGIDAGVGFDTNPYSVPLDQGGFSGDVAARIRPRANIEYPGSTLAFEGTAMVDYGFLPGLIDPGTRNLLLYQSMLSADVEVNRGGALRFAVGDSFSWNSDPGLASVGLIFNRIHNQLRAGTGFRPGGGALEFKLGYALDIIKYLELQQENGTVAEGDLDNMLNTLSFRTDYKFLPRTGFFGSVAIGYSVFDPFGIGTATENPTAFPLTVLVGVQGQILAKVAGLASIGYTNPFVIDPQDGLVTGGLIGIAGQAEIQWAPSPTTRMGGGFQRSFAPTALYQYAGNNRFYASLNQLLAGRFSLNLNAGYSILEFGEEVVPLSDQPTGRLDGHLDTVAGLTYFFTDWLSLGITDKVDWRVTNADEVGGGNYGFIRNQTFVLASLAY